MTETVDRATDTARDATGKGPLGGLADSEAADRLKEELREYVAAQAERLLVGAGRKLGETTVKLNDIAEGNSPGFAKLALDGGRKIAEGKGPVRSALELGASHAKESVTGALKSLGGKGKGGGKRGAGNKPTVIVEYVDVGVPLRTAYDQWTQFQDFSTFAKGVKSANRTDDTTSDWQMKIFWSTRGWKATTTEQVPDERIAWTSEGGKGTTKGVVSFHELAENLTRVLLVIEYYPKGFFEKTANIWRAQGRRARLDLKNYVRFITLKGEAEEGWRGEIRDAEVVRSHEDAVAEEEREQEDEQDENAEDEGPEGAEDEYEDSGDADEEYDDTDEAEDEYDDEPETEPEDGAEDEYDEADDEYEDDNEREDEEAEPEDETEYEEAGSRR